MPLQQDHGQRPGRGRSRLAALWFHAGTRAWHPRLYELYFTRLRVGRETRAEETETVLSLAAPALRERPDHVVEIGPGTGHYTRLLAARSGRVTAVEPSEEMRTFLSRRLAADGFDNVTLRAGELPHDVSVDEPASGVVAIGVLNYVADLGASLRTIAGLVRPGGWAVFSVPPDTPEGRRYQREERWTRRRCYTRSDTEIRDAADQAGLEVHTMQTAASVTRVVLCASRG